MRTEGHSPLEGKWLASVLTELQFLSCHCINFLRGKNNVALVYDNQCWVFLNSGGLNKSKPIHPPLPPSLLWIVQEKTVVLIRVMMIIRPHLDSCLLFCSFINDSKFLVSIQHPQVLFVIRYTGIYRFMQTLFLTLVFILVGQHLPAEMIILFCWVCCLVLKTFRYEMHHRRRWKCGDHGSATCSVPLPFPDPFLLVLKEQIRL